MRDRIGDDYTNEGMHYPVMRWRRVCHDRVFIDTRRDLRARGASSRAGRRVLTVAHRSPGEPRTERQHPDARGSGRGSCAAQPVMSANMPGSYEPTVGARSHHCQTGLKRCSMTHPLCGLTCCCTEPAYDAGDPIGATGLYAVRNPQKLSHMQCETAL
jgi:hypothetical protein